MCACGKRRGEREREGESHTGSRFVMEPKVAQFHDPEIGTRAEIKGRTLKHGTTQVPRPHMYVALTPHGPSVVASLSPGCLVLGAQQSVGTASS